MKDDESRGMGEARFSPRHGPINAPVPGPRTAARSLTATDSQPAPRLKKRKLHIAPRRIASQCKKSRLPRSGVCRQLSPKLLESCSASKGTVPIFVSAKRGRPPFDAATGYQTTKLGTAPCGQDDQQGDGPIRSACLPSVGTGLELVQRHRSARLGTRLATIKTAGVADMPKNVLGSELRPCCESPLTGFHRDGMCRTGAEDVGLHVICAQMTE